jgi:hypothetical protein
MADHIQINWTVSSLAAKIIGAKKNPGTMAGVVGLRVEQDHQPNEQAGG